MALLTNKACICCGDNMVGVDNRYGPHDPYCSDYCVQRAKFGKCKLEEELRRALEEEGYFNHEGEDQHGRHR